MEWISEISVEELKSGVRFDRESGAYRCLLCGACFTPGEVYPIGGRFYDAAHAGEAHLRAAHGSMLEALLATDSKYLSVTQVQKTLLSLLGQGLSDKEIAARLELSPSTVRHQRFVFREKYKQAKAYLALYELASAGERKGEAIVELHSGARMTDDRYVVTDAERDRILALAFASLDPLKLSHFPPKEKKKVVILAVIAERFERGRRYAEKEVNGILREIYDDYATLRRYLIEYGFMDRTRDCAEYWRRED